MQKKTINPSKVSPQEVYGILSSAIAPRPIAFASTIDKEGNVNLSPFSFFNVVGPNPPTLVFSPVRSMRTLENKDTLLNIQEVPEVTISVVTYAMVEQMSLASTAYDRGVDEFVKSGFTPVASSLVKPPFVSESPVSFECKVKQVVETGVEGGAGNLVICEVVMMHINEEKLSSSGDLDSSQLDLVARLGGNLYCRASGDALFEIPKPIRSHGIGVDALPAYIRNSKVLTGNNLGRLGNLERMPTSDEVLAVTASESLSENEVHELAKKEIEAGNTMNGLKMLLAVELD